MKRYRLVYLDFDARADHLDSPDPKWPQEEQERHNANRENIIKGLESEYGVEGRAKKIERYVEVGHRHASIIAFHNKFLTHIRDSYVIGAYYAALTAACGLGERLLNHMILSVRDSYKATDEYKNVYRKNSFDNWDTVINTLSSWGVLQHQVEDELHKLKELRHRSIHFNYETETNVESDSLESVKLIQEIIRKQFCYESFTDWIFVVPGEIYVKKSAETVPFVKKIVVLHSGKVGHKHEILWHENRVIDDHDYGDGTLTDDEYCVKRKEYLEAERLKKKNSSTESEKT